MAELLTKKEMLQLTPDLLEDWPNTYTFSKAIAEYFIKKEEGNIPACVFRPSISTILNPMYIKGSLHRFANIVIVGGCAVVFW